LSSQAGCPLGCTFCATGQSGFRRNLSAFEIIVQVLYWKRLLKFEGADISHLVFMGMGEPFLNYDEVIRAIDLMNQPDYFGIGSRHISVSTVGIVSGIRRFASEDFQVNLAVSLHSANDRKRMELMPVAKQFPLSQLTTMIDEYISKTNRKVMLEYMMIKGVNDSAKDAEDLCRLIKSMAGGHLCFVNPIPYNPTGRFQPSNEKEIKAFCGVLDSNRISYTRRYRFGTGITAACGQLAGKRVQD
jgi:23S rRNA (adenine2503-C2)-methyltransferase